MDLPDLPRWVEAHGLAQEPDAWRAPLGDGFAIGSARARLAVASPAADRAALVALAARRPDHAILVARERPDLAAAFPAATTVVLHTLAGEPPDLEGAAPLDPHDPQLDLAQLPPALAHDLRAARTPVHAVWVDDRPVAFAYAPWRSAAYFDISVDVLPGARQLGLGTIVAAACIAAERALGRAPVWGAAEDHVASLRLAARLGFTAVDSLFLIGPRA